ncbi:MAG: dihydrolipoamide acetyltransferase family protein, partial [Caldilineaceae bacterium]
GRIVRADVERAGTGVEAPAPIVSSLLRATPAARRLAGEAGISLTAVIGSGPSGRVQAADVQAAALEPEKAAPISPETRPTGGPTPASSSAPLRGVRRTIAKRVVQSWTTIPHIYLTSTIDMTRAEALRGLLGPEVEALGEKLTPTVLIARAVAAALGRHPRLNAHLVESGGELHLVEHESVHLGLAVALGEGLVVPVVRDAHTLGLAALAQQAGALVKRARANQLAPTDVEGGTFTVSNLGAFPVDHFTALIFPPQVAILAVGRMRMQPVWDGAAFAPRPTLEATLSADHRAVDGAVAAAFLAELKSLLEAPERMLL